MTDVELKTTDKFSSLNKTMTPDVVDYGIRVDRGIKVYILSIPSCIASLFGLDSMPNFVTDFGKGRVFITVNFVINEGSPAANETELNDWSWFVRNHCFKADHTRLTIGDHIVCMGNPLMDSSKGIECKVLRLFARWEEGDECIYCTLQLIECLELEII